MKEIQLFGFKRRPAPSVCPDCNRKLGPIRYDADHSGIFDWSKPRIHYRDCTCGCYITWSHPHCWKRHHVMPLFDDGLVIDNNY